MTFVLLSCLHINFDTFNYLDLERQQFFCKSLCTLKDAALKGYSVLQVTAKEVFTDIQQKFPKIPCLASTTILQSLPEDPISRSLLPRECQHLTVLRSGADGNCLYR